jgi:hypothetical protein
MQWHALVGSSDPFNFRGSLWSGEDPVRGNLEPHALRALCDLLGGHTADPDHCFFALWLGWGWVEGGSTLWRLTKSPADGWKSSAEDVPSPFSPEELRRACLVLPGREYLLLTGPLSAALHVGDSRPLGEQSPNMFWPADRAWFVASEIDFDSTLVGGTADLVQAILDSPALDAWPVGPDGSLAADGDEINRVA